jgi:hypothetical protein
VKSKTVYLVLAAAGLLLPYSQLIPWLVEERSLRNFFPALFANRISTFFAADVLVSAVVLLAFIGMERKRLPVRALWAPFIALFAVGVSLALPLFLYLREAELERRDLRNSAARA